MAGKILRSILVVVIAVLLASLAVVPGVLYQYFGNLQQAQLRNELHLAIALSVWLATRMAKRVVEPLNELDLEHPMENDAYEELSPLLRA